MRQWPCQVVCLRCRDKLNMILRWRRLPRAAGAQAQAGRNVRALTLRLLCCHHLLQRMLMWRLRCLRCLLHAFTRQAPLQAVERRRHCRSLPHIVVDVKRLCGDCDSSRALCAYVINIQLDVLQAVALPAVCRCSRVVHLYDMLGLWRADLRLQGHTGLRVA